MQPPILVLDEPTSGLDPRGRREVLQAIDRLRRERGGGMAVVMATQDAEAALHFADRVVVLQGGRVALEGCPADVLAQVDRMRAWGIDVPQLASLAHLLGERSGRRFAFLHIEEAVQALAEVDGASRTRLEHIYPAPAESAIRRLQTRLEHIYPAPAESAIRRLQTRLGRGEGSLGDALHHIEIQGLSYRYPRAEAFALADVDLQVRRGEWLAVIGINGSGKSTLIKHFNGLLKPTHGVVCVNGQDTRTLQVGELARTVSFLPQNPDRQIFAASVWDEVAYGPRQLGLRGDALDERVAETLDLLDLAPYAAHPPAVLGYGLRRQVALAGVLAMNTPLLALDEPTAGLDRLAISRLIAIAARRQQQGTTVVMITHDLRLAAEHADRVVVLFRGCVVAQGSPQQVLADLELLDRVGLEPLPVTRLAHALCLPVPLPLTAEALADRLCPLPGYAPGESATRQGECRPRRADG
jgi:energy-coupling factor transport system ATP-binding protein